MEADNKLFDVWQQFDFDMDPINAESEKGKFLKNKDYNPEFDYQKEGKLNQFKKDLLNIHPDDSLIGKLIKERRDIMLKKIEMLLTRKAENLTANSIELFGKPDKKLVSFALEEIKLPDDLEIKNLSDNDVRKIISRALSENKLSNWNVQIKEDMSATAKVNTAERIVYIKRGEKFSTAGVERLIVHELQSHAFRMENSIRQKYKIFQVGFPNYLETEEGLAAFNEEMVGYLLHNRIRRIYAGRVIAVNLALEKSFSEVFAELSNHFPEEDAWTLTVRAKRGLIDTSEQGGFTKDYLYLNGKLKIKAFLKKNKDEGLLSIYAGRISINHVKLLNHLSDEIVRPLFLPKYNSENSQ